LLKTLEEPPAHVIFMFATTEPHKIPATILSRCQRFDFRRVTQTQAQQRLAEVSKAENLKIETGALALIARAAEGSMRDALSLLDQVIAFSGGDITVQSVRDSVGLIEGQTLLGILTGIFARKPLDALELVEAAYQRGHDLRVLGRSLVEFLHAAILAKVGAPNSQTLELSEEEWKELRSIAALRELSEIELIFQVLHHGLEWIARSPQPKVVLDVLVIKCATAEALIYADSNPDPTGSASGPSTNSTNTANTAPTHHQAAPQKNTASQTIAAQTIAPQPEMPSGPSQAAAIAARLGGGSSPVLKTGAVTPAPSTQATPAETSVATTAPLNASPAQNTRENDANLNQKVGPTSVEGFVEYVRKSRPLLASILEHGSDGEVLEAEQALRLFYRPEESYYHKQVQNRTSLDQVLLLTKEYFGKPMRLMVELKEGGESLADRKERQFKDRQDKARQAVQTHPIIQEAKSLFGGELGPIELTDNEGGSDHV